jgi:hypothetical protein
MQEIHPKVAHLDLEPIMVKAMDSEEGFGWTLEFTQQIVAEYKKYLTLCLENPNLPIVPSSLVDKFWHLHILDTQKYQEDCSRVFGYFLHHFPYFGMRSEQDAKNLQQAWADSCTLYKKRFGELDINLWSSSNRCPNCGVRCRNGYMNFSSEERPRLVAAL